MKKINKYISMVALSALAMAFNACTDECEREASPVQTDGLTAYIDFNTLTSLEFLPDDEQAFEVKIGRQLATETATVHITAEGEKDENWIYRMWKYGFRDDRRNHKKSSGSTGGYSCFRKNRGQP